MLSNTQSTKHPHCKHATLRLRGPTHFSQSHEIPFLLIFGRMPSSASEGRTFKWLHTRKTTAPEERTHDTRNLPRPM
eukprot:4717872-Amphidinium_carterae.1